MERAELIDVTRRLLQLIDGRTTDLAPQERVTPVDRYTDPRRWERERTRLFSTQPQLVGWASEVARPGDHVVKDVAGTSVVVVRDEHGVVRAHLNACRHRGAQVVAGCGTARRFVCPFHGWTYALDGRLVGVPGRESFPDADAERPGLVPLPVTERHGLLWTALDPGGDELDVDGMLGTLGDELGSWRFDSWSPVGTRTLDVALNWKVAVDTFSENYHFAMVHRDTFFTIALSDVAAFDAYGPHHRLIFPLRSITRLREQPEEAWEPLDHLVVIYAIFPSAVMSVTSGNGELFRVYPGSDPGRSVTYHQNASREPLDDPDTRRGYEEIFEYAHATVRDEDYRVAATVQRSMEDGRLGTVIHGRNEPGLQHRHEAWDAAVEG